MHKEELETIILERIDHDPEQSYFTQIRMKADIDIVQAIKDAASEFLHTPEGIRYCKGENWHFNFGDAISRIPEEITLKHGYVVGKTEFGDVQVEQNECLIPDDLEEPEDEEDVCDNCPDDGQQYCHKKGRPYKCKHWTG
jgi:hypothetical protein